MFGLQVNDEAVSFKGQCHEVFDFRFFHESVSPKPLSILLEPFQIFSKFRGYIRSPSCTIGVVDTGANLPPLSKTPVVPVVHLDLQISPQIFRKI
jgi:hypothetical protein